MTFIKEGLMRVQACDLVVHQSHGGNHVLADMGPGLDAPALGYHVACMRHSKQAVHGNLEVCVGL